MWLAARRRGAQRVDVFARLRSLRRERSAIQSLLLRRQGLHEALIKETHVDCLVGHISRDSTAIEVREKPAKSDRPAPAERPRCKRGRPRKGEVRPAEPPRRIERQQSMSVTAMLAGADTGGRHWAIVTTRIQTAKLHDVDSLAWLTDLLERIVVGTTKTHELHMLLPRNWKAHKAVEVPNSS